MSESRGTGAADAPDALRGRIEALRREGGARADPVRFGFLEALSRRMEEQADPVRAQLQGKLHAALDAYAVLVEAKASAGQGGSRPVPGLRVRPAASTSPLAQLNEALRVARASASSDEPGDPEELASARRFHRTWTSLRIQDQVDDAVARRPVNAGPLNSHVLVLQSLDLMRSLSPQYLERFLAHVETLQWLEEAGQKAAEPQARPAKAKGKPRKG